MVSEDDRNGGNGGEAQGEVRDPEADLHDPEDDLHDPGAGLSVPGIELPDTPDVSAPSPEDGDPPEELASAFWILVLVANAALLVLALGAMFVVFRGNWDLGGRLFLAGGVLSVYGYYRYREFPDPGDIDDDRSDGTDDADAEDGAVDADPDLDAAETTGPPAGTVRDADGERYLLVKRSADASLVRDPTTGEGVYLRNDEIETVEASPLETAADGIPSPSRRVLSATHDDRSLGLLVELVDRGPVAVRTLLSDYDLCESDLHGLLGEFRAAGLVEEATVAGERGYDATELAERGVENLRATGPE